MQKYTFGISIWNKVIELVQNLYNGWDLRDFTQSLKYDAKIVAIFYFSSSKIAAKIA
jgi:hypothetical protein